VIPLNHMNLMAAAGLVAMQNNGHNYYGVASAKRDFTKIERGIPSPIEKPQYEAAPPRPVLPRAERKKILKTKLAGNSRK